MTGVLMKGKLITCRSPFVSDSPHYGREHAVSMSPTKFDRRCSTTIHHDEKACHVVLCDDRDAASCPSPLRDYS